jgi:hypothetical protein
MVNGTSACYTVMLCMASCKAPRRYIPPIYKWVQVTESLRLMCYPFYGFLVRSAMFSKWSDSLLKNTWDETHTNFFLVESGAWAIACYQHWVHTSVLPRVHCASPKRCHSCCFTCATSSISTTISNGRTGMPPRFPCPVHGFNKVLFPRHMVTSETLGLSRYEHLGLFEVAITFLLLSAFAPITAQLSCSPSSKVSFVRKWALIVWYEHRSFGYRSWGLPPRFWTCERVGQVEDSLASSLQSNLDKSWVMQHIPTTFLLSHHPQINLTGTEFLVLYAASFLIIHFCLITKSVM